jgi:hypothetical protein
VGKPKNKLELLWQLSKLLGLDAENSIRSIGELRKRYPGIGKRYSSIQSAELVKICRSVSKGDKFEYVKRPRQADRNRKILELYQDSKCTMLQIADKYKITKQRVSKIIENEKKKGDSK